MTATATLGRLDEQTKTEAGAAPLAASAAWLS